MTAYGAVNSLRNTLDYILHSSHSSLVGSSPYILHSPLQDILEKLDSTSTSKRRKKVNALDGRIKDLIWEFEDILESLLYQQILSQVEDEGVMKEGACGFQGLLESPPSQPQIVRNFNMARIMNESHVTSLMERLKEMEEEYVYEVDNMPEDDDEDESISTRSGTKPKMIGLSNTFQHLKGQVMKNEYEHYIFAVVGTAGVGKTALAETLFDDPDILGHFEHRAWVTVGRKSQSDDVLRSILTQISGRLEGKKCLIVLDDVWEGQTLKSLMISLSNMLDASIHILVTTRDSNVFFSRSFLYTIFVPFLNEEESKELLCEKVFGEKECPFQLDKAVTKIAKKCEGLPLTIVTVADILSKSQNTDPKYWDDVAEMRNSVFTDAYNEISKVLFPSYDYLPQYLKMPFLYLGVFPPDYDIPLSKITNMLSTEGWFHRGSVWECLDELCTRNLALSNHSTGHISYAIPKIKTCRLHSSWRYVCRGEARKNKFYHVFKKLVDGLEDDVCCM